MNLCISKDLLTFISDPLEELNVTFHLCLEYIIISELSLQATFGQQSSF